jgi:hypothetical protein
LTGTVLHSPEPPKFSFSTSSNVSFPYGLETIHFPSEIPLIRPLSSKLAFPSRTIASGEIHHRYLDPNAFATVFSEGERTIISLIDLESGSLVFETEIEGKVLGGAQGVHIVLVDNWLVFAFKRETSTNSMYEVVSTELYWGAGDGNARLVMDDIFHYNLMFSLNQS